MKTQTKTETQTKIQWTPKLNNESDWDGIELNDPETGITHASLDACTPEALALIAAAPDLLEALKWASERVAGRGSFDDYMKCQRAIAKAEGDETEARIQALEDEGLTRSDAQGVVMAEDMKANLPKGE